MQVRGSFKRGFIINEENVEAKNGIGSYKNTIIFVVVLERDIITMSTFVEKLEN